MFFKKRQKVEMGKVVPPRVSDWTYVFSSSAQRKGVCSLTFQCQKENVGVLVKFLFSYSNLNKKTLAQQKAFAEGCIVHYFLGFFFFITTYKLQALTKTQTSESSCVHCSLPFPTEARAMMLSRPMLCIAPSVGLPTVEQIFQGVITPLNF